MPCLVDESLKLVGREPALVSEHVVVRWPARPFDPVVAAQEKVKLPRVSDDRVHDRPGRDVLVAPLLEQPRVVLANVTGGSYDPNRENADFIAGSSSRRTRWNWVSLTPSRKKTTRRGSSPTEARKSSRSSATMAARPSMISWRWVWERMREAYLLAAGQLALPTTAATEGLESSSGCGWVFIELLYDY